MFTLDIVRVQNLVITESLATDSQFRRIYQIPTLLYPTKHGQPTNMLLQTCVKRPKVSPIVRYKRIVRRVTPALVLVLAAGI